MKAFAILMLSFLCFSLPVTAQSQSELLRREIEKIIKYEHSIDYNVVPGILIGVIDGDSIFRFAFGRDIRMQDVYEIGSITKPVVAWLINEALQSLDLNRSTPVCQFLPDSICSAAWQHITFNHILEHKTGLARIPPWIGEIEGDVTNPYEAYSMQRLGMDLKMLNPVAGRYSYSHMGYASTIWLFEKVGGLQRFTRDVLTIPLQMFNTGWEELSPKIAQGHGLDGRPQPPWETNALRPAIGLRTDLDDMLKFIGLLFEGYAENLKRKDPSGLKRELKALSKTGAYKVVDGWFVISTGNALVYYHNGRTGGHHASIAFTPHLKKAVVILSNGAMGSNDLSLLILRMINQSKKR